MMGFLAGLCLLAVLTAPALGQADTCSTVPVGFRVDCGNPSTTPNSCVASGCCWSVTTVPNEPNCFYPNEGDHEIDPQCTLDVSDRQDCGDVSTTPEGCIEKGCCWQVTPGAPYCYFKGEGSGSSSEGPTSSSSEGPTSSTSEGPTSSTTEGPTTSSTQGPTLPPGSKRIYVHMMPWFESKETNNGVWGMHWTMANKNPDNIVNGLPDIASFYHPIIGPYASGDPKVIDWQLGQMKLAGITGVAMDWPGTSGKLDYAGNLKNAEAVINACADHGLEIAIVYEDHNLDLAGVPDKIVQATADMDYIEKNYVSKGNYARVNNAPLLMTFGPQSLFNEQWDTIFQPFSTKPTFLILADKDLSMGGSFCQGGFAWVWPDYLDGLQNIYSKPFPITMGVAYPGFNAFYSQGGWGDIPWKIPVEPATFQATLDLALEKTDIVQLVTWNDYGEGTIIEPTFEFEYSYLEILQKKTGVSYNVDDLKHLTDIFNNRVKYANDPVMSEKLRQEHLDFVNRRA